LRRRTEEIELLSADVANLLAGSDALAVWPVHVDAWFLGGGVFPQYPGIVLMILLLAGTSMTLVRRQRPQSQPLEATSRARWVARVVWAFAAITLAAGLITWLVGPWAIGSGRWSITASRPYKPIGLALNLALVGAVLSPRLAGLVRSGSVAGLYATGAVIAVLCSLGPVGRVLGQRFWYKPPYAWLMALPGFESARVPARFAAIWVVCLGVLAAIVVVRLLPRRSRRSALAIAALSAAVVVDGWADVETTPIPPSMPVPVTADLVIELPNRTWTEEAPAMYRGMLHGRPVVNGYSAFAPPHYSLLRHDLERFCLDSLETTRAGRSLDVVIWRADGDAVRLDAAAAARWGISTRQETAEVIVYRLPATGLAHAARTDRVIDLLADCRHVRPRP
jgi:hypothetical protein